MAELHDLMTEEMDETIPSEPVETQDVLQAEESVEKELPEVADVHDEPGEIPEDEENVGEEDPELNEEETVSAQAVLENDLKTTLSATERQRRNAARRRERARKIRMEAPLDEWGRPIDNNSITGTFDPVMSEIARQRATREIIRGTIEDVRPGRNGHEGWVEIRHMDHRVLIPFSEMDIEIIDRPDESSEDHDMRLYRTISNMLGSNIEFVISGIDDENDLIAGSRSMATRIRRRDILNAKDRDGNYLIYPGRQVRGNVLAVHQSFAFVDVYGMRVRLRNTDIRSDYVVNAYDELENGMSIPLYVTRIDRDEDGNVTLLYVSMRNDEKEKEHKERLVQTIKPGDECLGRVTNRTSTAIFLSLNNGLQALAFVSNGLRGRRVPNIGDTVALRVLSIERNRKNGNPIVRGRIVRSINFNAR